jgi:NH3-dependent NAD+ synthetase
MCLFLPNEVTQCDSNLDMEEVRDLIDDLEDSSGSESEEEELPSFQTSSVTKKRKRTQVDSKQIEEIRELWKNNESKRQIARSVGVSIDSVN